MTAPVATLDLVVLDTPEPRRLAEFYMALLGWEVANETEEWVTVRGANGTGMAFQLAPDFVPPTWPEGDIPQQSHLDLNVTDLDAAEERVLALGATKTGQPAKPTTFRVYLDPSGHPFCLCKD